MIINTSLPGHQRSLFVYQRTRHPPRRVTSNAHAMYRISIEHDDAGDEFLWTDEVELATSPTIDLTNDFEKVPDDALWSDFHTTVDYDDMADALPLTTSFRTMDDPETENCAPSYTRSAPLCKELRKGLQHGLWFVRLGAVAAYEPDLCLRILFPPVDELIIPTEESSVASSTSESVDASLGYTVTRFDLWNDTIENDHGGSEVGDLVSIRNMRITADDSMKERSVLIPLRDILITRPGHPAFSQRRQECTCGR